MKIQDLEEISKECTAILDIEDNEIEPCLKNEDFVSKIDEIMDKKIKCVVSSVLLVYDVPVPCCYPPFNE